MSPCAMTVASRENSTLTGAGLQLELSPVPFGDALRRCGLAGFGADLREQRRAGEREPPDRVGGAAGGSGVVLGELEGHIRSMSRAAAAVHECAGVRSTAGHAQPIYREQPSRALPPRATLGDTESCYIVCGPYTYSGEPTVRLETSPGRPGLVLSAGLLRSLGQLVVSPGSRGPECTARLDAERPRDQSRHRGLVVASELLVQTGLVLDALKRRVRAAVSASAGAGSQTNGAAQHPQRPGDA